MDFSEEVVEKVERTNSLILALSRVAANIGAAVSPRAIFTTLGDELRALRLNSLVALRPDEGPGFTIEHSSIESRALDAVKSLTGRDVHGHRIHPERWPAAVSEPVLSGQAVFVRQAFEIALTEADFLPRKIAEMALRVVGWTAQIPSISAPLVLDGKVIGLLCIWGDDVRADDVPVFSVFAGQVATAIGSTRLQETLRRQMAELAQVQLQLLQSTKLAALGELAAFVAHGINNPLTSVVGHTWLALSDLPPDAPQRQALEVAQREAARIAQLIETLIAHTQQTEAHSEPISINEILESTLQLIRGRAERVELRVKLAPSLPRIVADPNDIRHICLNLLSNALDAVPDGGHIEVTTKAVRRNGRDAVQITVTDSGTGIPPEHLAHIFEPFFTTKGPRGRAGLGLAITKRIVEQYGGAIDVETLPRDGTRFVILFPL